MSKEIPTLRFRQSLRKRKHLRRVFRWAVALLVGWLVSISIPLSLNATKPVDAVLILGGSIQREVYAAELAKQAPNIPILISQGSKDPCIWNIFQQANAPTERVWLEKCANSTFENFCFSIPTLRQWKVHKVKVITSKTHLPRAQWLAQILLGANRIWVETEIVSERGIPGNRESRLKTALDVTRSLAWAIASQVYSPQCSKISRLSNVDWATWHQQGFSCERRAKPAKSAQSFDLPEIRSFRQTD